MVLDVQNRLETLTSTVADRVSLGPCREWPRTLRRMSVRTLEVSRMVLDLSHLKPLEGFNQAFRVLGLLSETALDKSLRDEGDVPELAAIGARHHHAVCPDPHEVVTRVHVQFVRGALRPVNMRTHDEVHHF